MAESYVRNPEVLAQWELDANELAAGARFLVPAALVEDTFISRTVASKWFEARTCVLGSTEAQGCLVVQKK